MIYHFISKNLIGDGLYISPALRQFVKDRIKEGDTIYLSTLPDHVKPLYETMIDDSVSAAVPKFSYHVVTEPLPVKPDFEFNFDVNKAFQISHVNKCHIATAYAAMLHVKLPPGKGELNPIINPYAIDLTPDQCTMCEHLNECILISCFSASCTSRDKNKPGLPPNKMLPWEKWIPMIEFLRNKYPETPIRFIGAPTDIFPSEYESKIITDTSEYMLGIPLLMLAQIMEFAKLVVTIDNGMSHLAAAVRTPTFLMYPRCLGPHYIVPVGNPNLSWVHIDPVTVTKEQLLQALQYSVNKLEAKSESKKAIEE